MLVEKDKYRKDIDGLRAIAVIAVLIFHLGFLPNGFLGVDVFFLISGYLITDILYKEVHEERYSVVNFYVRRVRRILPLVSFICLVALIIGVAVMLPDDLENLAQSVIATNFFGNNVLQVLTTKNYWDVVNEYKPLMHTWSLAVEEQYYFLYPIIFSIFGKRFKNWILPIIIVLTVISLSLYLMPFGDYLKFYLLPFRFFEMSLGGIAAILLNGKVLKTPLSFVFFLITLLVIIFDFPFLSEQIELLILVVFSCLVLCSDNTKNPIISAILTNPISIFIGKISFSLYMWHQLLYAFGRYIFFERINLQASIILIVLTFILSIITYYLIEQPFRDKKRFSTKFVIITQVAFFIVTTSISAFLYLRAGVVRNVPELDISVDHIERNMHSAYNHKNHDLERSFTTQKTKVLVLGDSFGRDWINVLQESEYAHSIEISYLFKYDGHDSLEARASQADIIFLAKRMPTKSMYDKLSTYKSKLWVVGTKNFGVNNGIYYNFLGDDYCEQETVMESGYKEANDKLKAHVTKGKYLDIISLVMDTTSHKIPIFTPNCKFISQDCRHFTKAGAKYFAGLINQLENFPLKGH